MSSGKTASHPQRESSLETTHSNGNKTGVNGCDAREVCRAITEESEVLDRQYNGKYYTCYHDGNEVKLETRSGETAFKIVCNTDPLPCGRCCHIVPPDKNAAKNEGICKAHIPLFVEIGKLVHTEFSSE